jgi:hypothetical protein
MDTIVIPETLLSGANAEQRRKILEVLGERDRSESDSHYESLSTIQLRPWRICDNCYLATLEQSPNEPTLLIPTCPYRSERTYDEKRKRVECAKWRSRYSWYGYEEEESVEEDG